MKLADLQKPMEDMSDEELLERLREIRHNRFVERPAAKKHEEQEAEKAARPARTRAKSAVEKLVANLTPEQREALMKQLQGSLSETGSTEENPT